MRLQKNIAKCPNYMELINRMLNSFLDEDMIFTNELWEQMTNLITSTKVAEDVAFEYFLQNYKELKKKFYFMKDMWTTMVTKVTQNIRTEDGFRKLMVFYEAHKEKLGYTQQVVKNSIKDVKDAVEWVKKNGPDLEYWFENVLPQYH
ncbi:hypothetical protein C0J52_27001 [Blattella germanica]|nr:hypothetical protein C0J52_27001 [Blattella germanica]